MADGMGRAWLRLLADPCGAPLTRPCYVGTSAGYLTRHHQSIAIQVTYTGTAGSIVPVDAIVQWTPWNISATTGRMSGGATPGTAFTPAQWGTTLGPLASASRCRPVAACIKFIPTGPYASRSGQIGGYYSPGPPVTTTSTSAQNVWPICSNTAIIGAEQHEVRWLPTDDDQDFGTFSTSVSTDVGSVGFVLRGVDATVQSGGTAATVNGTFEIITCYEMVPSQGQNQIITVLPPPRVTMAQVLSGIADLTSFVHRGLSARNGLGYSLLTAGAVQSMRISRQRIRG